MLSDKIWDLRLAMFVVQSLRQKRNKARRDFHCDKDAKGYEIKQDDFNGGAHLVEVNMPMRCGDYNAYQKCEKDCPHHDWNNCYIELLARLRAAKHERNMAILGLFLPQAKMAQYLEYERLKKYADAKKEKYDAASAEWTVARRKISQTSFGCACIINHPKVFGGIIAPEFVYDADNGADFCNNYVPGGVCFDETCSWWVNNKEVAPIYKNCRCAV